MTGVAEAQGRGCVKTQAEEAVTQPQAKGHMAGSQGRPGRPSPGPLSGGGTALRCLDLRLLASRTGQNPLLLLEAIQSAVIRYGRLWQHIHQADGERV